jgi:anti-anti-sigma factor
VSGVVFLSPQPKRARIHRAVTRLRFALHHALIRRRRPVACDPPARAEAGGLYPIGTTDSTHEPCGAGELHVRCRRSRGRYIIEPSGALNARTHHWLAEAIEDALETDAEEIVLDLGDVESIDGAGLGTVLAGQLRAGDELRLLVIIPGLELVQRVLEAAQGPFLYGQGHVGRAVPRPRRRAGGEDRSTPRRAGTRRGAAW